jgi:MFS family permease
VPLYLQIVKGATPTKSGLLLLPMMAGIIGTSIISGRLISRVGRYKWFTVVGTAVMGIGLAMFTRLEVATPLWQADIYMLVIGVGLGMAMQPLILAVQNSLDLRDMGAGTSAATFFRSLGGSVGVAALGAVLSNRLATELGPRMTAALHQLPAQQAAQFAPRVKTLSINEPASIKLLPAPIQEAIQQGFVATLHPIFLVAALVSLTAVVLCLALPNRELRGAGPAALAPSPQPTEEAAERTAVDLEAKTATMM